MTTNGSQDGLCKTLEMLADPGDTVVIEDYSYFATKSILDPIGVDYVVVETDRDGMVVADLEEKLKQRSV